MKSEEFVKLLISAVKGLSYKETCIPNSPQKTAGDRIAELHNKDYITFITHPEELYYFGTTISLKNIVWDQNKKNKFLGFINLLNLKYFDLKIMTSSNCKEVYINGRLHKKVLETVEDPADVIRDILTQTIYAAKDIQAFLKNIKNLQEGKGADDQTKQDKRPTAKFL